MSDTMSDTELARHLEVIEAYESARLAYEDAIKRDELDERTERRFGDAEFAFIERTRTHFPALVRQLAEANKVIGKLPVTADGVPIVDGLPVEFVWGMKPRQGIVLGINTMHKEKILIHVSCDSGGRLVEDFGLLMSPEELRTASSAALSASAPGKPDGEGA